MNTPTPTDIYDNLMDGLSLNDLITMVYSNEPVINSQAVSKCFEELVKSIVIDARAILKSKMNFIIKEANRGRND